MTFQSNNYSFGYDQSGNVYIFKDDDVYTFDVSRDYTLELFKVNKNKIEIKDSKYICKKINKQNALHIKSIENAIDEIDEMSDEEQDNFKNIKYTYNEYKYNPEKKYYHSEEYILESDDDERQIQIYNQSDQSIRSIHTDFDIPSYETLIINGNVNSNDLIFRTEIINDQPLYRITIHTSGVIFFNIIGSQIKKIIVEELWHSTKSDTQSQMTHNDISLANQCP
jgi:hypothetical protein